MIARRDLLGDPAGKNADRVLTFALNARRADDASLALRRRSRSGCGAFAAPDNILNKPLDRSLLYRAGGALRVRRGTDGHPRVCLSYLRRGSLNWNRDGPCDVCALTH